MTDQNAFLAQLTLLAENLSGTPADELATDAPFFALGFDSLFLTQFAAAVQKEFKVRVTFRELLETTPTLGALAGRLAKEAPASAVTPAPAPVAAPATPAPAPAEPPAAMIAPIAPVAPIISAAPVANPDGLAGVFAAQLALMHEQIRLLSGAGQSAPQAQPQTPLATPVPAAPAITAAAAQPQADAPATPSVPKGFGPEIGAGDLALTPAERAHLENLTARYNARTASSKARTDADRPHFADPRTAAGFNTTWKELVYPIVVERSEGAYLWDVDGNRYVDMLNGFGPNFFGHRAPFITEALRRQLSDGFEVGPQTPRAGEAAKLFCELTGMDRVSWVNTGSEAVQAAIRIARTVTGKDKIVLFSGDYHGNFDEVLVRSVKMREGARTLPLAPGIPASAVENVIVCDYGEDSALETIAAHADEIAAVLVEPVQSRRPDFQPREFLHALRKLTEERDIVLVFDEVITGFRIRPGGAQEFFGVKADLATYGKIIGGGMPIGVVAGRARFMDTFDGGVWRYGDQSQPTAGVTFFAGTFVRHPFAIAAAHASLSYIKAAGPALQNGVNARTTRLANAINDIFAERGVEARVAHFASQMFFRMNEKAPLAMLFFYHLRERGVHILENFPSYVTAAHTDADIDFVIDAVRDSILEMQADGVLPVREGIAPAIRRRAFPLTSQQAELWAASLESDAASCAFNESDSFVIRGDLDADRFTAAAQATFDAEQAFSLRIAADGSGQSRADASGVVVTRLDLSGETPDRRERAIASLLEREATTPFNLEKGPLARAFLAKLGDKEHLFIVYAHHIAFDGYSSDLLMKEIARRYAGDATVSALSDFSVFAARAGARAETQAALDYWAKAFDGAWPASLNLPTDRPRKAARSFAGATAKGAIPAAVFDAVQKAARAEGVGVNAALLAAHAAQLGRISGKRDFIIGLPVAGQAATGVDCIGFCVFMAPMRVLIDESASLGDLARRLQRDIAGASEHANFPIGELARRLGAPRDGAPLIQTVFNYSSYFSTLSLGGCTATPAENPRRSVFHESFLNLIRTDAGLAVDWDYTTEIFDRATIESWINDFAALLAGYARDRAAPIEALTKSLGGAALERFEF